MKSTKQFWPLLAMVMSLNLQTSALQAAPYLGVAVGAGSSSSNGLCNGDKTALTGRVNAGLEWKASENFKPGVEVGLQGYQKSSRNGTSSRSGKINMDALAVADFMLNEAVDVKALGGIAYVKSKCEVNAGLDNTIDNLKSKYHLVPKLGMGVGYNVFEHLNLNLTVFHEFKKNHVVGSATSVLAGIQLK